MRQKGELSTRFVFAVLVVAILATGAVAETLYVDSTNGNDTNPGTEEKPLKTINKAAQLTNSSAEPGSTLIKMAPGLYSLTKAVVFENNRPYTKEKRLIIEATILPDDANWKPELMPVIISTERLQRDENSKGPIMTSGLKTEVNHVTIRGLKFLGSPVPGIRYYPVFREGKNLKDLVVSQCLFVCGRHALAATVSILANGHKLVVDHCVFYNCRNPIVFWNAEGGISKGNAMRYCIVDGAYTSGIWTCQTSEDLEFQHNIITRREYFWMRAPNNREKYRISNCVVTDNKYNSGYCTGGEIFGQTGPEVTFYESNIVKTGEVTLEMGDGIDLPPLPRNYLHVQPNTLGSELGAGLFKKVTKHTKKRRNIQNINKFKGDTEKRKK